jgi:PAS domain S-box-containing protein
VRIEDPHNEAARLEALRRYRVLDSAAEQSFDDITALAASLFGMPIALITFLDSDRTWVKSRVGWDIEVIPSEITICSHVILHTRPLVVPDVAKDDRFATRPFVAGPPHIRFYAGCPLIAPEGIALGTLCVLDKVPREFSPQQVEDLGALSRQVIAQLELRRHAAERRGSSTGLTANAQRRRVEHKLRRFESLVENSSDLVGFASLEGEALYLNRAGRHLLGIPEGEASPRHIFEHISPDDLERARDQILPLVLTQGRWEGELGFRHSTGARVPMHCHAFVVDDPETGEPDALATVSRDLSERRRAEEALRESEQRFRQLAESIREVFFLSDVERHQLRILYISPAYEEIWGRPCASLYENPRSWLDSVHPEDRERVLLAVSKPQAGYDIEYRLIRADKTVRHIWARGFPIRDASGEVVRVAGLAEDVTLRKHLEDQLRQSQKLEAIGQLAGGVAHDFNNILVTILNYAELAQEALPLGDPVRTDVREIQNAARRAANLTRQLLAFSRRQIIQLRVLNLSELILNLDKMLRRLIGEDIELVTLPATSPALVRVDPGQFEQLLVNLAVNARDAMPTGGRLVIQVSHVMLEAEEMRRKSAVDLGTHVELSVRDDGVGMDGETMRHIFEPFFTTKSPGRGTGLGLATVYGIVQQNHGSIRVESTPGGGTAFRIFLPRVDETSQPPLMSDESGILPAGSETVLLVEDEPAARAVAARVLRRQGYTVIEAANGEEALRVARDHEKIHLLLTDVVMPRMGGPLLAEKLHALRSDLRVLFTSGYTDDAIIRHGARDSPLAFLQKPYTPGVLARKVREVLDR